MMSHKNAKSTALGRMAMVQMVIAKGRSVVDAADAFGVSTWTVRRWLRRYLREGKMGLYDRSSEPLYQPTGMPRTLAERVVELRRQHWTYAQIAKEIGRSHSAFGRICKAFKVNRLDSLDPKKPVIRYERAVPGELLHLDTKKLGRIDHIGHRITGNRHVQKQHQVRRGRIGYEFAHVCIDDASRVAYVEILPNERKDTNYVSLAACDISSSSHIGLRQTVRRSASSRQRCGNGRTKDHSRHQMHAPRNYRSGSIGTTFIDRIFRSTGPSR